MRPKGMPAYVKIMSAERRVQNRQPSSVKAQGLAAGSRRFFPTARVMDSSKQPYLRNRLLALLPMNEIQNIASTVQPAELPNGIIIVGADCPIDHLYFLCSGIGSVVTISAEGQRAEVKMFGRAKASHTHRPLSAARSASMKQVAGEVYEYHFRPSRQRLPTIRCSPTCMIYSKLRV